jgi:hypothetical protein
VIEAEADFFTWRNRLKIKRWLLLNFLNSNAIDRENKPHEGA